MEKKSNQQLQTFYDSIYHNGKESYFSKFEAGQNKSENDCYVLKALADALKEKTVLDIGCGTGELAHAIANSGARQVTGIDYSKEAIKIATDKHHSCPNLCFECQGYDTWTEPVDIIVSCGTLEHMDEPAEMIKASAELLNAGGQLVLTCPHFYNMRGLIWITLQKLLNVPMSLTDLHSISPKDIKIWGDLAGLNLTEVSSFDYDQGNGPLVLHDMKKRLANALRDAQLSNDKVDEMLQWMNDFIVHSQRDSSQIKLEGATGFYILIKG